VEARRHADALEEIQESAIFLVGVRVCLRAKHPHLRIERTQRGPVKRELGFRKIDFGVFDSSE
jgi:hypothetical protein